MLRLQIRQIRMKKGLSQDGLANKSGVSQGKISEYESGKSIPRLDSAAKIALALDTTIDHLIMEGRQKDAI